MSDGSESYILLVRPLRAADAANLWRERARFGSYDEAASAETKIALAETRSIDEQFRAGDALETQVVAASALPTTERDRSDPRDRIGRSLEAYGGLGKLRRLMVGDV